MIPNRSATDFLIVMQKKKINYQDEEFEKKDSRLYNF